MPINVHDVGTLRSFYRDGERRVMQNRSCIPAWKGGLGFPIQRKAVWVVLGVKITFTLQKSRKHRRMRVDGLCDRGDVAHGIE